MVNRMNDYRAQYEEKLTTPEGAVSYIENGQCVFADIGPSQPKAILDALGERAQRGELSGVALSTLLDIYPMACYQPDAPDGLHAISLFCGTGARQGVNAGRADVLPGYYRDFPRIVRENRKVDVFCAAVSPMDRNGYFSMGTTSSISQTLIDK